MLDHIGRVERSIVFALALYTLMSLFTIVIYWLDKQRAMHGGRRVSESTLHAMELLGGWPGALVAQQVFRHKRRKLTFCVVTWLIAGIHVAAWVFV